MSRRKQLHDFSSKNYQGNQMLLVSFTLTR
jgi:hypothetical protein